MINNKKVLALIPARGGSKGIPNKNIIELNHKPLISYSIEAARMSKYIDRVMVSTDSSAIAQVAEKYGAYIPFMRPAVFASDWAATAEAVWYSVTRLKEMQEMFDILVLLQPTSPLRTVEDIDNALETFEQNDEKGLVSISEVEESPYLIRTISNQKMRKLIETNSTIRRQDMPLYYKVNGSVYINRIDELNNHFSFNDNPNYYIMEKSHSVDIDEWVDLEIAEFYIKGKK